MNTLFKTPQEAIAAVEENLVQSWETYLAAMKLDPAANPQAIEAAKAVFRSGYMAGAKYISGVIVEKMLSQKPQPPTT